MDDFEEEGDEMCVYVLGSKPEAMLDVTRQALKEDHDPIRCLRTPTSRRPRATMANRHLRHDRLIRSCPRSALMSARHRRQASGGRQPPPGQAWAPSTWRRTPFCRWSWCVPHVRSNDQQPGDGRSMIEGPGVGSTVRVTVCPVPPSAALICNGPSTAPTRAAQRILLFWPATGGDAPRSDARPT